jgi:xanthine dehydrogenase YagS FAD-binding subunit
MQAFEHVDAMTAREAVQLLATDPQSRAIAGGTDLIPEMRLGVRCPDRLVNLKTIRDASGIQELDGYVQIGALTPLSDVAQHPLIQSKFPCLVQAILDAASPQIRNLATLGGNLCQDSRCWYFRGPFHCWLKGGTYCNAEHGDNRHQAIFGGGPCFTVHPSDPATALLALRARLGVIGLDGERNLSIAQFFVLPHDNHRSLNCLQPGEVLNRIDLPWPASGERAVFLKAMDRAAFSFALVSIACVLKLEGERINSARVVLGGVAPIPWRANACERALIGQTLNDKTIKQAAYLATRGARPLAMNGYKLPLVQALVERALDQLAS